MTEHRKGARHSAADLEHLEVIAASADEIVDRCAQLRDRDGDEDEDYENSDAQPDPGADGTQNTPQGGTPDGSSGGGTGTRKRTGPKKPRHSIKGAELRVSSTGGVIRVSVLCVPWNVWAWGADEYGPFRERMMRGCADDLLAGNVDTRFLIGHDDTRIPVARTAAGTAVLSDSPEGLRADVTLDAASNTAQDLASAIRRGDLTGASIAFSVALDGEDWDTAMTSRSITKWASLPEVSFVAFPWYGSTAAKLVDDEAARKRRQARAELELLQILSKGALR